ncbi:MAG: heparinase II/III family protein [Kiritimatiellae bacterium]|nr:heparinase II/III family protein [Kiritimatiellia bacterium]
MRETPGFVQTASFPALMTGASNLYFNFGDNSAAPEDFANMRYSPFLDMCDATQPKCIEKSFTWASCNTNFPLAVQKNGNAYVGTIGALASRGHGHMDAGSFVYDKDGVRWVMDLGMEEYSHVEAAGVDLWDSSQDGERWKLYRLCAQGHNTLTRPGEPHEVAESAKLLSLEELEDGASRSTWDLQNVLGGGTTARRTFTLHGDGALSIEDAPSGGEVEWTVHTSAAVDVEGDGIVLRSGGKSLAIIATPAVEWRIEPAKGSHPADSANDGVTRISCRFSAPMEFRFQ